MRRQKLHSIKNLQWSIRVHGTLETVMVSNLRARILLIVRSLWMHVILSTVKHESCACKLWTFWLLSAFFDFRQLHPCTLMAKPWHKEVVFTLLWFLFLTRWDLWRFSIILKPYGRKTTQTLAAVHHAHQEIFSSWLPQSRRDEEDSMSKILRFGFNW